MPDIDHGPEPFITDIEQQTLDNTDYRRTLWTGSKLQLTLMTIQPGHDIGLEVHPNHDQFLRIEEGEATVYFGKTEDSLTSHTAGNGDAVFVPAGTWHNLENHGNSPLKLYSLYGPADHAHGTIHHTKEDAEHDPREH